MDWQKYLDTSQNEKYFILKEKLKNLRQNIKKYYSEEHFDNEKAEENSKKYNDTKRELDLYNQNFICLCGGRFKYKSKNYHFKSKKHQRYLNKGNDENEEDKKDKKKEADKRYREKNKEKIAERAKEFRQKNKEKINEYQQEYRKNSEIIECDCGSKIKKINLSEHLKTIKHKDFIMKQQ
jgi:hypothetical protein